MTSALIRKISKGRPFEWACPSDGRSAPFFIIGSGRSGTTLLRRLLLDDPAICIPAEHPGVRLAYLRFARARWILNWPRVVDMTLASLEYHRAFDDWEIGNLSKLSRSLGKVAPDQRSFGHIIDSVFRTECGVDRSGLWGDKTPALSDDAKLLLSVFPDARFVHLVRDGVDVVESLVRAGLANSRGEAATRWVRRVTNAEAMIEHCKPGHGIRVTYEDLVQRPLDIVNTIRAIVDLQAISSLEESTMGLERVSDVRSRAHHRRVFEPLNDTSIGRGRRVISSGERHAIGVIANRTLTAMGYSPV